MKYTYGNETLPYEIKEFGGAEINVRLSQGKIRITHSDGTILFEKIAKKGDWEKIWGAIDEGRDEWLQGKYEYENNI
jgi:hypothetical protein